MWVYLRQSFTQASHKTEHPESGEFLPFERTPCSRQPPSQSVDWSYRRAMYCRRRRVAPVRGPQSYGFHKLLKATSEGPSINLAF